MESGKVPISIDIDNNKDILSSKDLNTVNLDGQIENVKSVESRMNSGNLNGGAAAANNPTASFG